ncbi:hypothetical protein ACH3VR_20595 [Microbacterium sp. B2969]|uniref:Uncharacterized protein n=1 Tax=Microbacterium alkaliflavum TaxID=3248839 RepID=A0ABW7QD15_9MICO
MDREVIGTSPEDATAPSDDSATPPPSPPQDHGTGAEAPPKKSAPRRRARLGVDLALLGVVGVVLVAAVAAGAASLYREFYSPSAFVERYLDLLAEGHAADALGVAGVSVDSAELEAAGLPATASDALLRSAALATLADVHIVSETPHGTHTDVVVEYRAGRYPGQTTFEVERDGTIGVAPTWRFAKSPLAVVDLTVRGSMEFEVNGFSIDKRQVSVDGVDADPGASVPLLVFSPGVYSVSVDTALSSTPGIAVLSDSPLHSTKVDVQAEPTAQFKAVVQEKVEAFLSACATQDVLLPTACPFGYTVEDRIVSAPKWSIVQQPAVSVAPDGANWAIPQAEATAHIEVDIRSLFDGTVRHVSEDVPFLLTGKITVQPDGSASIVVVGTDTL